MNLFEDKELASSILKKLTTVFLILLAGVAAGYWWAICAYGVLD